jgi:serpin B
MKRIHLLLPVLFIVVAFVSCKKGTTVQPNKGKDLALTAIELQQASADNTFTLNLFKTVASGSTNDSNIFLSPLSVSIALGMTSNGASGQTLDAMRSTLNFNGFTQDEVNSYYNKLITQLPELDPNTTLKIANSLWYRQGFSVSPQFLQTNTTDFKATIQALDFSNPASVNTMNNWVSDQTSGKITKIVNAISPGDMMYLVNAIYFKSSWASKFDPAKTTKLPFNLTNNSQVQTDFMRGTQMSCNVSNNTDATLLELPYSNNKYSMVIVMSAAGKSVSDILAEMDSTTWESWTSRLSASEADITMPKFTFSFSANLDGPLSSMGMSIAFSPQADFSNINPGGGLQITSVNHKAFVAVDENGTTASAATSVVIGVSAVLNRQITVDHPFIFVIREMKTGLILFTGTVNDPTQSGL